MGNAGAERVRGRATKMPKPVQTQCPQCSNPVYVDADADTTICGHCGAILQKQGATPPPPQATPEPKPQPVVNEPEEEKQAESEENEPDQTETEPEPEPATSND